MPYSCAKFKGVLEQGHKTNSWNIPNHYIGDEGLPLEIFEKTYARLSKAPGAKYKFIMEAGSSLKPAQFNLCDFI